jgi:hypothetical protein
MNLQQGKWFYVTRMSFVAFRAANEKALQTLAEKSARRDMPADEVLREFLSLELNGEFWLWFTYTGTKSVNEFFKGRLRGVLITSLQEFNRYFDQHEQQIIHEVKALQKNTNSVVSAGDILETFLARMRNGILFGGDKDIWKTAPISPEARWDWVRNRLRLVYRDLSKSIRKRHERENELLPDVTDARNSSDPIHVLAFREGWDLLSELQQRIVREYYWSRRSLTEISENLRLPYATVLLEHKRAISLLEKHVFEDLDGSPAT